MIRAGSSPGGKRPGPVLAWVLPAVASGVATAVAVSVVDPEARFAVAWCGVVATVAVAALAGEVARRVREVRVLRARLAEREELLERRLARQEAATVRLAKERLPEAVERLQEGEFAEDVLLSMAAGDETLEGLSADFRSAHEELLRSVVEAVQAEETMRDSAQRGVVNIARRVQAIVHQQAKDLREMEDRHGRRPEFFADLLRLDHGTALIGRLADSIAVLGGARPGRQWSKAVPLYSVLRGAMSRIIDYQRVELHSVVDVAVVGPAVEPLIHALAELLDNATRYSPPKAKVHLTAGEVHAGIAIEIEDGGVGLSEEARARAEQMLRQAQAGIDLNDLGEAPRLGLAVVGRLAQAYDFQVSLPPSAYGGVRAVLVVPAKLVTTAPATGKAHGIGAASGPRPAAAAEAAEPRTEIPAPAPPEPVAQPDGRGEAQESAPSPGAGGGTAEQPVQQQAEEDPPAIERNANGLPQRRRRRPDPAARAAARTAPGGAAQGRGAVAPEPAAEQEPAPGMWMAALQSGLSGEGSRAPGPRESSDKTSDEGE
ncbi:sensor histidine kinase KdpD [Streptomyces sp. JJ36]|uniref:sensor histidine kinase n=1 Tax=Streptomyces sp. JJ36 TaxID=2736645 RepID=UPI001F3B1C64|nr:ATP-binding protein [Streptomyces sp. JJ36]